MKLSHLSKIRDQRLKRLQATKRTMHAHVLVLRTMGKTRAATAEEYYGFQALQVADMHFHKIGCDRGLWYRLKDGRVFDAFGKPSRRGLAWYTSPSRLTG